MNEIIITHPTGTPAVRQADTDAQLLALWLHGRPDGTTAVYKAVSTEFMTFVDKPLRQITLGDIQKYAHQLEQRGLRQATRLRKLAVIKGLSGFAHRLGYLAFDVARAVRLPGGRSIRAERILDEGEVHDLISADPNPRNALLLMLIYVAGLRVSEACGLRWSDLQTNRNSGQVTVTGKGMKTRSIPLPNVIWHKLKSMQGDIADEQPIFRSRKKGHLRPAQVWTIVRQAAKRAGLKKPVSTHWLRHAHASHALDNGAPISLVQATLGHASVATTGVYLHARPNKSSAQYLGYKERNTIDEKISPF